MLRRWTISVALGAALLTAANASQATTLRQMGLDELTASAAAVARVRCLSVESRWLRGEIFTFSAFEVLEVLKGSAPARITVRLIGGRAGHLISTVDGVPRFRPGEEAVLFLEPTRDGNLGVTGWVQGTFRIRRDPRSGQETVTQDTSGLSIFNLATRQFRPGGIRNLPLPEFRQRVQAAAARSAGRQK